MRLANKERVEDRVIGRKEFKKLDFSILEESSKWILKSSKMKITVVLERLTVTEVLKSSRNKIRCSWSM